MSPRTWTFILLLAMLPVLGCSQRYILRMSSPEQSTTVTFFEKGSAEGDVDDTVIVLDEPKQIARVHAFFKAREERWNRLEDQSSRARQSAISFRNGDRETDRFWLERDRLCFQDPDGKFWTCELSDAERAKLKNIFWSAKTSKS